MNTNLNLQEQAAEYAAHGWRLVPLGPDKRPVRSKWNTRARVVDSFEEAAALRSAGVGLAHAYSGTAAIDVDDEPAARAWFDQHVGPGSLQKLRDAMGSVLILSPVPGRFKLLYRLPAGAAPLRTWVPVKGLEFRCGSANGMTVQDVLPPSPHPKGGHYQWAGFNDWRTLSELPLAVEELWTHHVGASPEPGEKPADYPPALGLSREETYAILSKIDPDVSYPEWIKVGQALQHEHPDDGLSLWEKWSAEGSKYPGSELLESKWAGFGHSATPVTMRSIIRDYASAASDDEFEVIPDPRVAENRPGFVSVQDMAAMPLPRWIIRGILPEAALGVIYGPPGSGKSFIALDMAMTIARGIAWNASRVSPGRVIYVAAEGFGGMVSRVRAYLKVNNTADVPGLTFYRHSIDLAGDEWQSFTQNVAELGGADVIVFDTLARCIVGADENSSEGMSKVIHACEKIHRKTGALVLLVHHSGKDVTRGARGWSGLKGAVDVEMEVARVEEDGALRSVRLTKQKDGDDAGAFFFKLVPVDIGQNDQGDDVPAKVIEYVEREEAVARTRKPMHANIPQSQRYMWEVVHQVGVGEPVTAQIALIEAHEKNRTPTIELESVKRRVARALKNLQEKGMVALTNEEVTVCQ